MNLPDRWGRLWTSIVVFLGAVSATLAAESRVALHWLDSHPTASAVGASWGVPWPRGTLHRDEPLQLVGENGQAIPLQTWPMAFWPDGSIKWTGQAAVIPAGAGSFTVTRGAGTAGETQVRVTPSEGGVEVSTGAMTCRIGSVGGAAFLDSLSMAGRTLGRNGTLVLLREDRSTQASDGAVREQVFSSVIDRVDVEQSGPVRAVIKVTGRHQERTGGREWLPFTLRLYFFAGQASVRLVHTFVFDGDQEKDFIRGLGVRFEVPLRDEVHNRHVRFSGMEGGVWAEPVRLVAGREPPPDAELLARQLAGKPLPPAAQLKDPDVTADMPAWGDFKLRQLSSDGFTIEKRTSARSAWITAGAGRRTDGAAFVGDTQGGLAVAMKDFWQLAPTAIGIDDATEATAQLTAWLWSPDAPAMDLRHYDTHGHGLKATYEDSEEGHSTATGVARTHELTLTAFDSVPSNDAFATVAQLAAEPPRLVCEPAYYHSIGTFGPWSLPDRSTPAKRYLEEQLDRMFAFYQGQVEERRWYGFWDYGDVMHTYDHVRHTWKYDVGGYAWMNSEEIPDTWLWYSFLRSGRADVFRMAEAMTRHTQEVDAYHIGPFVGLGSRHNVRHWGDGSKEVRIAQAQLKRFYYYLTTDERTGDLITEVANADQALVRVDPLRKILKPTEYPTHARSGPDWLACAGNWMAMWERTGDVAWRDKIVVGMRSLAAMPQGLLTALSFGYDPATGELHDVKEKLRTDQFVMIFGGAETGFELATLIDEPGWKKAWLDLCEEWAKTGRGDMAGPRAAAYAAWITNNPRLGARAWELFGKEGDGTGWVRFVDTPSKLAGAKVPVPTLEYPGDIATGHLSQWALNVIESLELAGEWLPENVPQP